MKQQRFEIGQAVTPKDNKGWIVTREVKGIPKLHPKFGAIIHVRGYLLLGGEWFISFVEGHHKDYYLEDRFDPIITTDHLEEDLKEIEIEVTV